MELTGKVVQVIHPLITPNSREAVVIRVNEASYVWRSKFMTANTDKFTLGDDVFIQISTRRTKKAGA